MRGFISATRMPAEPSTAGLPNGTAVSPIAMPARGSVAETRTVMPTDTEGTMATFACTPSAPSAADKPPLRDCSGARGWPSAPRK